MHVPKAGTLRSSREKTVRTEWMKKQLLEAMKLRRHLHQNAVREGPRDAYSGERLKFLKIKAHPGRSVQKQEGKKMKTLDR